MTLPDHDTTGLLFADNEQRARRAGKSHGMNCLITATSSYRDFRRFWYNFRFDPTGLIQEGDLPTNPLYVRVVKVIPKEELV